MPSLSNRRHKPSAESPQDRGARAVSRAVMDCLEGRRLLSTTITGSVTLDESVGLQTGGSATANEDNNDNDVALSVLQTEAPTFYNRLFGSVGSGGLGLSTSFVSSVGVGKSAADFITVSSSGAIVSLGFSKADGTALPVLGGAQAGIATGLNAVVGGAISSFADTTLGNRVVIGKDAAGDVSTAMFMVPNATLTSARVWTVQLEALLNPDATDFDDPVTAGGLGVAAGISTTFDFSTLPSGQNLFGMIGDPAAGLIVVGKTPVINADGTYTNTSNTINTSQGGGGTTIGVNNQMFDPGEGAFFTFVNNPDPNFLGVALDANEADDADNLLYSGGTLLVESGFLNVVQTQGGGAKTLRLSAFNIDGSPQGRNLLTATKSSVNITEVRRNGTVVFSNATGAASVNVNIAAGDTISWKTNGVHDQVLVEGIAGKWDIGGFGTTQGTTESTPLTGIRFEDDGPAVDGTDPDAPPLTVDETTLGADDTFDAGDLETTAFDPSFGQDGTGTTTFAYALSTPGGASGLTDTLSGQSVILSLTAGGVLEGRTASSGLLVFSVSIDSSGLATFTQFRAVVHPTTDPDESVTLVATNLVQVTATTTDADGDQTTAVVNVTANLVFKDDGPSISASATNAPTLTVDESDFATNSSGAFAPQFTPVFGNDGPGATPVTYALSTPGGASGLTDTLSGQSVVLSLTAGGVVEGRTETSGLLVFSVSVNGSGQVTLDQSRSVVHADATNHDDSRSLAAANLVVLTGTAHDGDADNASAPLNIGQLLVFKDDGPSITASATNAPTLTVDESNFAGNSSGAFSTQFSPVFGADGQGTTPVTYAVSTPGGNSGLTDTASGLSVFLFNVSGQVVGKAGADATAAASGPTVFTVSVNASGQVTLDQLRSVVHADATNPDDSRTLALASLVVLTGTAHDCDADSAAAQLNIGQLLVFEDDGPAIGPIDNGTVDFASGSSVTKTLNGLVGADPNAAPYTIDSFTGNATINGVLLTGVRSLNQQVVTYWADTGGNGTFGDAGDTAYYRLTLGQTGAGTYTFEVLVNPPPATVNFNFNELPSGQNLFGMLGDPAAGLIVFGKAPVINADGTYTNTSNTINTSKGGGGTTIGVNNQMFDPGEGAYFTFVKEPDPNVLGVALDANEADDADNMLYAGGTLLVESGFLNVVQTQGGGAKTLKLSAWNVDGNPQGRDLFTAGRTLVKITEVKVNGVVVFSNAAGVASVNVNIAAGDTVSWKTDGLHDQVLVEGVAGKWDIGGFGTTQGAPTPDQVLHFVAKVTDGDGDTSTSGFSVGIDGTGTFDDDIVVFPTSTSSMFGSNDVDEGDPAGLLA